MYALIIDNEVSATGNLPAGARDLTTGAWVTPPAGEWSDALAATCGWFPVVEEPRPDDTAEGTWDRNPPALVAGVPTVTWTARPWTAEELAAQAAQAAREADLAAAHAILATIQANIHEAKATKVTAQTIIDGTAPTNVSQCWTKIKDTLQALKATDNALIGAAQGVKDLAKYVAP